MYIAHITMTFNFRNFIAFGLKQILTPVVKFCLRHSVRVQDLWEILKETFIEISKKEIASKGQKITVSRLSVMTGLHRREVMKLIDKEEEYDIGQTTDLISKVIGQWQNDSEFCSNGKRPAVLSYGEVQSEFSRLVGKVSNDLNPATVLFELERVNAVEKTTQGVKLLKSSYSPKSDPKKGFRILSSDINDLLFCVEENIFEDSQTSNLHARTEYDNIDEEDADELKEWIRKQGHDFHKKLREKIANYDRDYHQCANDKTNLKTNSKEFKRTRIVVSAFSRIETNYGTQK